MKSFTLTAIGQVAAEPEFHGKGEQAYTTLALIGNDRWDQKSHTTTVRFVAFAAMAKTLAEQVRKGDQLIIEAAMKSEKWVDAKDQLRSGHSFIVQDFRFEAPGRLKPAELADRSRAGDSPSTPAPETPPQAPDNGTYHRNTTAAANGAGGERIPN